MPTIRANDISIYYEVRGSGEPLVLVVGLAADISEWEGIIEELARDYRVIAFDNRGAGRSDKPNTPYSIEMMADDTAGLLAKLGVEQAHFLGVSMGGKICMEMALRYPEMVGKLVLVSTSSRVVKTWRRTLLFRTLPRIPILKGRHPQPYGAFARQREASAAYNCTDRLGKIKAPTLIAHGKKDKSVAYSLAEEMHAKISGSKMLAFEGGHLFLFVSDRERRKLFDAMADFLGGTVKTELP